MLVSEKCPTQLWAAALMPQIHSSPRLSTLSSIAASRPTFELLLDAANFILHWG